MSNFIERLHLTYDISRIQHLRSDFERIVINFSDAFDFAFSLILALLVINILLFLGRIVLKIIRVNFENAFHFLVSISVGYVVFTVLIASYGIFFVFDRTVLILSICILSTLSIFFNLKCVSLQSIPNILKMNTNNKGLLIILLLFIVIAFLKLIPPETGVDAILYHLTFPRVFLERETLMIYPSGSFFFITVPLAGQMLYVTSEAFGLPKTSQIIHFLFYVLSLGAISYVSEKIKKGSGIFASLLLATNLTVMRHTSTAYVDNVTLLLWILAVDLIFLEEMKSIKKGILLGLITGGIITTKLQSLAFMPVIFFLAMFKTKSQRFLVFSSIMILVISISGIWFYRSYILTGNPVYPQLTSSYDVALPHFIQNIHLQSLQNKIFSFITNVIPVILISSVFVLISKSSRRILSKSPVNLITFLIFLNYIFLSDIYFLHRNQVYFLVLLILLLSPALYIILQNRIPGYFFKLLLIGMSFYYFFSAMINVPYGLGWAHKDAYLSRVLARDNSSYYDFEKLFEKHINENETVLIEGVNGLYYFPFRYAFAEDIVTEKVNNLQDIKQKGFEKILLKRYGIAGFCEKFKIECKKNSYKMLAYHAESGQYLYRIE